MSAFLRYQCVPTCVLWDLCVCVSVCASGSEEMKTNKLWVVQLKVILQHGQKYVDT